MVQLRKFRLINEYNDYLIYNEIQISLKDYFKQVHDLFYPEVNIRFMNRFLRLCKYENEFIVDFDIFKKGDKELENIENNLSPYTEGINYIKKNIDEDNVKYEITPRTYKLELIKRDEDFETQNYYLLLETIYSYYSSYQKKLFIQTSESERVMQDVKFILLMFFLLMGIGYNCISNLSSINL